MNPAKQFELVLELFRKEWDGFPVKHMLIFLEVAKNDIEKREWGVVEIGERLGINQSTVSRSIIGMSPRAIPTEGAEPIDLLTTRADRIDYRKKIPCLTPKGKRLYEEIISLLEVKK